jgi:hypothetical protein
MRTRLAVIAIAVGVLAGCGLQVQAEDLFLVTRTGQGQKLTMLVNYDGGITCNGGKPKQLSDPQLLQARDLTNNLDTDASAKPPIRFNATRQSVYSYTVKVQNGTFTFPDTAGATHKELSQLELFVVQAAANPCGVGS